MPTHDVVIVGGGIAGSALGMALAAAGIDVLILEKSHEFVDENRGELVWPWGVAEARRLAVFEVLVAAGALVISTISEYDEVSDAGQISLSGWAPGVEGSLNIRHPLARQALIDAARAVGATVRRGVSAVAVEAEARPSISWVDDEGGHQVWTRLIVGSDGRRSVVQRQAGFELKRGPIEHYSAGALIRGSGIPEDVNTVAHEKGRELISFPQGDELHRTYVVFPADDKGRYSGPHGVTRFFADCALQSLPGSEAWADAQLAEPLATFPCGDTWIDEPVRDGVALIGDAGGYNNFLIGQGLSLALRDAAELADRLQAADWAHGALLGYGRERAKRLEKARIRAAIAVMRARSFRDDARGRQRFAELLEEDDLEKRVGDSVFTGGHDIPLSDYRALLERYRATEAVLAA